MGRMWGMWAGLAVGTAAWSFAGVARAQDTAAPAPATPPTPATTAAPTAPTSAPAAPATPTEAPTEEQPDHDRFVHHIGVTYFDITALPIANIVQTGGTMAPMVAPGQITSSTVSAPVVGVRYWLTRMIGFDAGIGLGYSGGSQEAVNSGNDQSVDKTSSFGFAFHGGVPIAFAHGKHYSFLVIPGFTIGATTGTFKPQAPGGMGMAAPEQDLSGFLFDIGARIGAEVHFGFIGIPELALQATVGLSFRRSVYKWKSDVNSASDGTNGLATTVDPDPWAIFKDAISATYYF
jgi:hypothetical protein